MHKCVSLCACVCVSCVQCVWYDVHALAFVVYVHMHVCAGPHLVSSGRLLCLDGDSVLKWTKLPRRLCPEWSGAYGLTTFHLQSVLHPEPFHPPCLSLMVLFHRHFSPPCGFISNLSPESRREKSPRNSASQVQALFPEYGISQPFQAPNRLVCALCLHPPLTAESGARGHFSQRPLGGITTGAPAALRPSLQADSNRVGSEGNGDMVCLQACQTCMPRLCNHQAPWPFP